MIPWGVPRPAPNPPFDCDNAAWWHDCHDGISQWRGNDPKCFVCGEPGHRGFPPPQTAWSGDATYRTRYEQAARAVA